jgi:predicted O-methyltransferase YrrM
MDSSYIQNNCGEIIKNFVVAFRPLKAVELGVLNGYSTSYIAEGLKFNKTFFDTDGHLDSYDLWEEYKYKHGDMQEVQQMLKTKKLDDFVTLNKGNAFEVYSNYNQEIDFLHVDISNTGEIVRKIIELWNDKIVNNGIVIFEGGSEERDKIEWMISYGKSPIKIELENNSIIKQYYTYTTYIPFPSMTVLIKK